MSSSAGHVEVVCKNTCTTVGEAPHWEEHNQCLVYTDIKSGNIHRYCSYTNKDTCIHLYGHVGFAIPRRRGGYVCSIGPNLVNVEGPWEAGMVVTDRLAKADALRFNDGKCDPIGRLWSGTLGPEERQRALYSLETDGLLKLRMEEVNFCNGMAWNNSGHTMYFVDTTPRHVYAFDFHVESGNISNQRLVVDFNKIGPESAVGKPDGMCIDNKGNLWVACFDGGAVRCFDPTAGHEIMKVNFPDAQQITSCCFGGKHYDDLYVTSAKLELTEEEHKAQPLAGSVFKVTGLGAQGSAPTIYEG